jgi:hypothetical protein
VPRRQCSPTVSWFTLLLRCHSWRPFHHLQKSNSKYGNEHEAIAVYHMMRGVEKFCPIYTLCIGNAFGEAALLLAAGSKVRQQQQQQQLMISFVAAV